MSDEPRSVAQRVDDVALRAIVDDATAARTKPSRASFRALVDIVQSPP